MDPDKQRTIRMERERLLERQQRHDEMREDE
jgi:hypothetical protein